MSSLYGRLAALSRRLQSINQLSAEQDVSIKMEDLGTDFIPTKYICAECAWTTTTNAGTLARHFTFEHASHLKCLDCRRLCKDPEELKTHHSQKHRHLCLSCKKCFPTEDQRKHHGPCESQHHIQAKVEVDASSHAIVDQIMDRKASASVQIILNRKSSVQSGSCPDPECHLTFLDFNTLYDHYIRSHPICIINRGHPKPFKCPFCPKRYQNDRFVPAHIRTHKPKTLNFPGAEDVEDQEALIRQSHDAMAHRRSQSHDEAQAQVQADRTSSDEELRDSIKIKDEDDFSLLIKHGILYIDEGLNPESLTSEQRNQTNVQVSQHFSELTSVGLVLQARPTTSYNFRLDDENSPVGSTLSAHSLESMLSDPMQMVDDYPERFALDEDEIRSRTNISDSSVLAVQLSTQILHQTLSREIVRALQMQHFIAIFEIADLFLYFLDDYQRMYVLQQLGSTDFHQNDSNIIAALQGTVLKDLIQAWVNFKRLALHHAPQLVIQAHTHGTGPAQSITWALLQHCLNLENTIYRNETDIAHPFLRDLPFNNPTLPPSTPFPRLIAALADRVKNRIVHDSSVVFTNEMILRGTKDYIKTLQMTSGPLSPIAAGHEKL